MKDPAAEKFDTALSHKLTDLMMKTGKIKAEVPNPSFPVFEGVSKGRSFQGLHSEYRAALRQAADVYAAERARKEILAMEESLDRMEQRTDYSSDTTFGDTGYSANAAGFGWNECLEAMRDGCNRRLAALEQAGKEKIDERGME